MLIRTLSPASTIQDNEGKPVLRVVDAAPFAYDADDDVKKVRRLQNYELDLGINVEIPPMESVNIARVLLECDEFSAYGRATNRHDFDVTLQLYPKEVKTKEATDPTGGDPYDDGEGSRHKRIYTNKNGFLFARLKCLTPELLIIIKNNSNEPQIWEFLRLYVVGGNG